jgi:hypothetical protein
MEPFWNMVRIDQVIGRAVRTGSHLELPEAERNVEVYIYTSVFTPEQLKSDFTLKRKDDGLTSDAHIWRIAQSKDHIIQTFLDHMKTAAMDCRIHASTNKLTSQGLKCYAFPIPLDASEEAFVPSIEEDALRYPRLMRTRKIQGRVISVRNKKYVIVDDFPNKFFDYDSYKHAGVLVDANIS